MDKLNNKNIGSLNEHTLHLALKNYLEPNSELHEAVCRNFVVDIKNGSKITEIETRSFSNIAKKLPKLLDDYEVTVVYPIAKIKWVVWIDPESGELSEKRRSPKKGKASDVCYELYKLRSFLLNKKFKLKLVFLEITEYKRKNGWDKSGKRGATREERIPEAILGTMEFSNTEDYIKLADIIPKEVFTAADFAKLNKQKPRYAWYTLNILLQLGIITRAGESGKAFLYKISEELSQKLDR